MTLTINMTITLTITLTFNFTPAWWQVRGFVLVQDMAGMTGSHVVQVPDHVIRDCTEIPDEPCGDEEGHDGVGGRLPG